MSQLAVDLDPNHPRIIELRKRLDAFYSKTTEYNAFKRTPDRRDLYTVLVQLVADRQRPRVLEVGCGRSGFGTFVAENGIHLEYHAQDVTEANLPHLRQFTDHVHIGDISTISRGDGFDLVFSTYVLEHVSAPRDFLENIRRLLAPGGHHVIVSPRYDLPGYLCPSLRHLGLLDRARVEAQVRMTRLKVALDRRPRFIVNLEPAVFHVQNWYRDSDAIHLVARRDIVNWHVQHGFSVSDIRLPEKTWKGRLLTPRLRLALDCQLPGTTC